MSTFSVTIEQIRETRPIEGADRIEVASLAGMDFEFVIGKGQFKSGDRVLYLPVDSVLPPELIERLGLVGRLAGKDKNRVKTLSLRGQVSQGIVTSLTWIPEGMTDPQEITAQLGITKYEPPELLCNDAVLTRLPEGQGKYDIESADRFLAVTAQLMDAPVTISEKVEGSNFWTRAEPDGSVCVGQREHTLLPREGAVHTYHAMAEGLRIAELARLLAHERGRPATIYGEALGPKIQGNIYQLRNHTVRIFDIRIGSHFLPATEFLSAVRGFFGGSEILVPVLLEPGTTTLREWLAGRSIKEASNGRSLLADRLREGIVIKPLVEEYLPEIGRLVIKQRSPLYLAKSEF